MKPDQFSPAGVHPMERKDAFTLVELLTATAILSLLLVLMFQIVSEILQSTKVQNQQMESVAAARRALDVMACDLQNAVVGEDISILVPSGPGTNLFSLLAYRKGPNGGDATNRFLAVSYSTNGSDQLFRSYGSVDYSQTNFLTASYATNTPPYPLASHILGVEVLAVTESTNYPLTNAPEANWATNAYNSTNANTPDGFNALITTKPNFASGLTNRTYALQVWIAAVDEQNYALLTNTNTGKLDVVKAALANASDPSGWRDAVDAASIPTPSKSGIRILDKTITLP